MLEALRYRAAIKEVVRAFEQHRLASNGNRDASIYVHGKDALAPIFSKQGIAADITSGAQAYAFVVTFGDTLHVSALQALAYQGRILWFSQVAPEQAAARAFGSYLGAIAPTSAGRWLVTSGICTINSTALWQTLLSQQMPRADAQ